MAVCGTLCICVCRSTMSHKNISSMITISFYFSIIINIFQFIFIFSGKPRRIQYEDSEVKLSVKYSFYLVFFHNISFFPFFIYSPSFCFSLLSLSLTFLPSHFTVMATHKTNKRSFCSFPAHTHTHTYTHSLLKSFRTTLSFGRPLHNFNN